MIFFLVMPGLFGGFGNYFVVIFQGSPEVVYPRVNNFSILILSLSYLFLILSLISEFGGGTGWTLYHLPSQWSDFLSSSLMTIGLRPRNNLLTAGPNEWPVAWRSILWIPGKFVSMELWSVEFQSSILYAVGFFSLRATAITQDYERKLLPCHEDKIKIVGMVNDSGHWVSNRLRDLDNRCTISYLLSSGLISV